VRADATFANGYYAELRSEEATLYKRVAGSDILIGSAGDVDALFRPALTITGSTIRVSGNGVVFIEVTDTTFSAAGNAGFEVACVDGDSYDSGEATVKAITLETPYLDVGSLLPGKAFTNGLTSTIGVGYLGAADIALISQSILATLQANTIPVDVQRMNSAEVIGTGTTGDAWRGVGVLP